jgi:hypothetical protein
LIVFPVNCEIIGVKRISARFDLDGGISKTQIMAVKVIPLPSSWGCRNKNPTAGDGVLLGLIERNW